MTRRGNLWPTLVSFENLFGAAQAAAAGKKSRPDVAAFLLGLEWEVVALRRELLAGTYRPGAYRTFEILDPKPRLISAAPFRDRVVHHALTRVLEPVFERRFSPNSFACRTGLGTHAALRRAAAAMREHRYALRLDIRKYFASLDHSILSGRLAEAVKCKPTLALAGVILAGSNPQEEVNWYFPGDDLFTPWDRRRGLPLGNQTSQFFANVYLDPLDQMMDRSVRLPGYTRYVDDCIVFANTKGPLRDALARIHGELGELRLLAHPGKSRIHLCRDGVTFLGWRMFPGRLRLARENVTRFRRRLEALREAFQLGVIDWEEAVQHINAWNAHAAQGDTWRLREAIFTASPFQRRG